MAARCAVIFWPISATAYLTVARLAVCCEANRAPWVFQPRRGGCRTPECGIVTPHRKAGFRFPAPVEPQLPSATPLRIPQAPLASPQDEPVSSPASLRERQRDEHMREREGRG